jgi:TRAP-type transport system periplasmic protein
MFRGARVISRQLRATPGPTRRALVAGGAAAFSSIALIKAPAKAAQFEFKTATNLAVDHPSTVRLAQMWAAIERESGGRIQIQFFPNSLLGSEVAMFTQLRLGAIQFFLISPGNFATVVPAAEISFLGFAYKDADEALRVMDGSLGAYVRQEAAAKGLYVFKNMWDSGMFQITSSSHPIRNADDMHGFKIRVTEGKITIDLFKTLEASPVPLSYAEIYTSLQTKIVDGVATPLVTIEAARWYEVQKYVSLTNHAWSGLWLIANGSAWNGLPSDLQAIVERNHAKYANLERADTKAKNKAAIEQILHQGLLINTVDQSVFRARLRPYYEYWANAFGPKEWGLMQTSLGHNLG